MLQIDRKEMHDRRRLREVLRHDAEEMAERLREHEASNFVDFRGFVPQNRRIDWTVSLVWLVCGLVGFGVLYGIGRAIAWVVK